MRPALSQRPRILNRPLWHETLETDALESVETTGTNTHLTLYAAIESSTWMASSAATSRNKWLSTRLGLHARWLVCVSSLLSHVSELATLKSTALAGLTRVCTNNDPFSPSSLAERRPPGLCLGFDITLPQTQHPFLSRPHLTDLQDCYRAVQVKTDAEKGLGGQQQTY